MTATMDEEEKANLDVMLSGVEPVTRAPSAVSTSTIPTRTAKPKSQGVEQMIAQLKGLTR